MMALMSLFSLVVGQVELSHALLARMDDKDTEVLETTEETSLGKLGC